MSYSIEYMREEFNKLLRSIVGNKELGDLVFNSELKRQESNDYSSIFIQLKQAYSRENRHYHTLEHIYHVLNRLKEIEEYERTRGSKFDETTWQNIKWGAWFHDYYNNQSNEDELKSANKSQVLLPSYYYGIEESIEYGNRLSMIRTIILATDHKKVPLDYPSAILCDADLAIFATNREAFDLYEENIRKEYSQVPEELYRSARYKVLQKFYDRGKFLYNTQYARDRWVIPAMKNLEYSMNKLKG